MDEIFIFLGKSVNDFLSLIGAYGLISEHIYIRGVFAFLLIISILLEYRSRNKNKDDE